MKKLHLCCIFGALSAALLLLLPFIPSAASAYPAAAGRENAADTSLITRLTARILEENHYRAHRVDQPTADMMFEEYFKLLDPQNLYFTQEDIDRLAHYRTELIDELKSGNAELAFAGYDIFKKRIAEYRKFAEAAIANGLDLTQDDYFTPDRSKMPRPGNDTELLKLWDKRLKNDVLFFRMLEKNQQQTETTANSKPETAPKVPAKTPEQKVLARLKDLTNDVDKRGDLDILSIYLTALAQVYGPHSSYMSPAVDEDFEISMSLSLTGIGATLTSDDGYIRIVSLTPGGPAELDGRLQIDDRIVAVKQENGEAVDVIDMPISNAVKLIRGPENTQVTLTVIPAGRPAGSPTREIVITRKKIDLKEAGAKSEIRKLENGATVGIVTLPSFYADLQSAIRGKADYRNCTDDMRRILRSFQEQKVDAVVFDLRNNGGGSLYEAIRLSGLFIGRGPVVQIRNKNGAMALREDLDSGIEYAGPLVILTNKLSASASEIFTGAMQDYGRALIVGDSRTYGKGTVLDVVDLDRILDAEFKAGSIKYETAVFFRISGGSVQQLGITPDIVIPSLSEVMEFGELYNRHHLPWDEVAPADYAQWPHRLTPGLVSKLKSQSAERIEKSGEFKKIRDKSAEILRYREGNRLSLNESRRYQEYLAEKALEEADPENPAAATKADGKKAQDPVLDEALSIAADLAENSK